MIVGDAFISTPIRKRQILRNHGLSFQLSPITMITPSGCSSKSSVWEYVFPRKSVETGSAIQKKKLCNVKPTQNGSISGQRCIEVDLSNEKIQEIIQTIVSISSSSETNQSSSKLIGLCNKNQISHVIQISENESQSVAYLALLPEDSLNEILQNNVSLSANGSNPSKISEASKENHLKSCQSNLSEAPSQLFSLDKSSKVFTDSILEALEQSPDISRRVPGSHEMSLRVKSITDISKNHSNFENVSIENRSNNSEIRPELIDSRTESLGQNSHNEVSTQSIALPVSNLNSLVRSSTRSLKYNQSVSNQEEETNAFQKRDSVALPKITISHKSFEYNLSKNPEHRSKLIDSRAEWLGQNSSNEVSTQSIALPDSSLNSLVRSSTSSLKYNQTVSNQEEETNGFQKRDSFSLSKIVISQKSLEYNQSQSRNIYDSLTTENLAHVDPKFSFMKIRNNQKRSESPSFHGFAESHIISEEMFQKNFNNITERKSNSSTNKRFQTKSPDFLTNTSKISESLENVQIETSPTSNITIRKSVRQSKRSKSDNSSENNVSETVPKRKSLDTRLELANITQRKSNNLRSKRSANTSIVTLGLEDSQNVSSKRLSNKNTDTETGYIDLTQSVFYGFQDSPTINNNLSTIVENSAIFSYEHVGDQLHDIFPLNSPKIESATKNLSHDRTQQLCTDKKSDDTVISINDSDVTPSHISQKSLKFNDEPTMSKSNLHQSKNITTRQRKKVAFTEPTNNESIHDSSKDEISSNCPMLRPGKWRRSLAEWKRHHSVGNTSMGDSTLKNSSNNTTNISAARKSSYRMRSTIVTTILEEDETISEAEQEGNAGKSNLFSVDFNFDFKIDFKSRAL